VDGIVITRDASISLVGRGCLEDKRVFAVKRNGVLEDDGLIESRAMALEIVKYRVAKRRASLVVDRCDLDDFLGRELELDIANSLHRGEHCLVLEAHQRR